MKIARDIITLVLAGIIAKIILAVIPPKKSFYGSMPSVLSLGPLEESADAKSLMAVGLVSKKSVMDGPSTKLAPNKPAPTVPEHVNPPAPETPAPPPPKQDSTPGPSPSVAQSSEMTNLPQVSSSSSVSTKVMMRAPAQPSSSTPAPSAPSSTSSSVPVPSAPMPPSS